MEFHFAEINDVFMLAGLNAQLIRDEGHRNTMTEDELAARMAEWLAGNYRAVLFADAGKVLGYALFRREPEFVYLRQFFVVAEHRRRGVGRAALAWLWQYAWSDAKRVRIDVLIGNTAGIAFWHATGFQDYCLTMEMDSRAPNQSLAKTPSGGVRKEE